MWQRTFVAAICFRVSRKQLAVATTFKSNSSLMSLVGDSRSEAYCSFFFAYLAQNLTGFTTQKIRLKYARIADEHMYAIETLAYPVEGADQLFIIAEIALTRKDFALASHLSVESLQHQLCSDSYFKELKTGRSPRSDRRAWPGPPQPCQHWLELAPCWHQCPPRRR